MLLERVEEGLELGLVRVGQRVAERVVDVARERGVADALANEAGDVLAGLGARLRHLPLALRLAARVARPPVKKMLIFCPVL